MSSIESLLKDKAIFNKGWVKSNNNTRLIRIGNVLNCNNDGLIRDLSIEKKMIDLMNKYNIKEYKIKNYHTKNEFSYELEIKENEYLLFLDKLKKI